MELFTTRMRNGQPEVIFCPKCIFRIVDRKGELCPTCQHVTSAQLAMNNERQELCRFLRLLFYGAVAALAFGYFALLIGR